MTEKPLAETIGRDERTASLRMLEERLGLSFLGDPENARETIALLLQAKEKFEVEQAWRGGVAGEYSISDVLAILTGVDCGQISMQRIAPNPKLAILEALIYAGEKPPAAEDVAELRRLAEDAVSRNISRALIPAIHGLSRRGLTKNRAILLAVAMATVAGAWTLLNLPDWLIPSQQNNEPRVALAADGQALIPGESQIADQSFAGSSLLEGLSSLFESEVLEPTPIPLVESLPSAEDSPLNLWGGIDLSDSTQAITIEWDAPEIVALNNGEPLGGSIFANPKDSQAEFYNCLYHFGLECSMALNGKVFVLAHSSWNGENMLSMEEIRAFLEGGSRENLNERLPAEERLRREQLLESNRPTITQGTHRVSAQAAIVRIEEADRDGVLRDSNTLERVALAYEPELGTIINLARPYLDLITCGWRLSGDRLSPKYHSPFSSSIYNLFLGEAPTAVSLTPTPTP